jgi:hypothetical protein
MRKRYCSRSLLDLLQIGFWRWPINRILKPRQFRHCVG